MTLQQGLQHRVHRRLHVRAVALQAVGHPGQVRRREQGEAGAGVRPDRPGLERAVAEDEPAVDGRHQRRRVAHDDGVGGGRLLDACVLRLRDGKPFVTDSGNAIIDVALGAIPDPGRLSMYLNNIPGVVDDGLFIDICGIVLMGTDEGVKKLVKKAA